MLGMDLPFTISSPLLSWLTGLLRYSPNTQTKQVQDAYIEERIESVAFHTYTDNHINQQKDF